MADFGKLNFSVAFNPTSAFPLDARCYFTSLADAQAAAAKAEEAGSTNTVYYYGQKLVVVADGVVTWYTIQTDKTLREDGSGASGSASLPSVTEADNGKVMMVVDGKWAAGELPMYEGAYTVTPSVSNEQTLETAQTFMDADVKIEKVPYVEVSNISGGVTATIGETEE